VINTRHKAAPLPAAEQRRARRCPARSKIHVARPWPSPEEVTAAHVARSADTVKLPASTRLSDAACGAAAITRCSFIGCLHHAHVGAEISAMTVPCDSRLPGSRHGRQLPAWENTSTMPRGFTLRTTTFNRPFPESPIAIQFGAWPLAIFSSTYAVNSLLNSSRGSR
jgi:hypothetical protein